MPGAEKPRLSDSLSSIPTGQLSANDSASRLTLPYERVLACLASLEQSGFSADLSEQIAKELTGVRVALAAYESGQLLVSELIKANKFVASKPDHRNVEVLRYGLQQLADCLKELQATEKDTISALLPALNELAAMSGRALVTENVFSVPDVFKVESPDLRVKTDSKTLENWYLEFSQLLHGIQRGDARTEKAKKLSVFFERLAEHSVDDDKPRSFWLACSVFLQTIEQPAGELRPAVFSVLKQIEKVAIDALGGGQRPVLGIQIHIDRLLCNLLCYIHCRDYQGENRPLIDASFGFTEVFAEVDQLRDSTDTQSSAWVEHSVFNLLHNLRQLTRQLTDREYQPVKEFIAQVLTLRQVLMLVGVHGAGDNLKEVADYLAQKATDETLHSATVSFELVEQQMMYQFGLVGTDTEEQVHPEPEEPVHTEPEKTTVSNVNQPSEVDADFVVRCNTCIDVIQHALDTALGSSGNLMPDNSVVSALNKLNNIVVEENIQPLVNLLTPLSQFLTDAENSTLNQSETLLVQEAIIAATLGIDSLVSENPMPDLIGEVTARIELAEKDGNYRSGNNGQQNSSFNGFLNEAEELQPRLFELFQRWRGAPDGASRLSGDINQLLHMLKQSGEEVGQTSVVSLTHYLESAMVDLRNTNSRPSQEFFDLAIESVESLGDDIVRLRNNEEPDSHSDLIDRLKLAGAVDSPISPNAVESGQSITTELYSPPTEPESDSKDYDDVAEESKDAVIFDRKASAFQSADWHRQFERVDDCFQQISHRHAQLYELQRKLETTLQNFTDDNKQSVPGDLQFVVDDLQKLTRHQGASIEQLDKELGSAAEIAAQSLSVSLADVIAQSAKELGLQVRFEFSNQVAVLERKKILQILQALEPLLKSIVGETVEDAAERAAEDKSALATIEVTIAETQEGLMVEVVDDGAGVSVQDAESDYKNPWSQASKSRFFNTDAHRSTNKPSVWSNLTDQTIDIDPLLNFAALYGGTVVVNSDSSGSSYRVCVPHLVEVMDVLLLAVEKQKFAIAARDVNKVGLWEGETALSIAELVGIKKPAFEKKDSFVSVQCGVGVCLLADKVLGHQSLEVTLGGRVFPDSLGGFEGVGVDGEGDVFVLLDVGGVVSRG